MKHIARTSTRCKQGHTTLDNHSFQILLLHDFRYSLGRQTGAVDDCVTKLNKYWDIISPCFQAQMQNDIANFFDREDEKRDYCYGTWMKILALPLKDDDK